MSKVASRCSPGRKVTLPMPSSERDLPSALASAPAMGCCRALQARSGLSRIYSRRVPGSYRPPNLSRLPPRYCLGCDRLDKDVLNLQGGRPVRRRKSLNRTSDRKALKGWSLCSRNFPFISQNRGLKSKLEIVLCTGRRLRLLHGGDPMPHRVLHLFEGAHLDLAHPLARDAEFRT